jgi:hypothetical protein
MTDWLYAATVGIMTVTVALAVWAAHLYRRASELRDELRWIRAQTDRARKQIASGSQPEVLTGLQTLLGLRDTPSVLSSVRQIHSLSEGSDPAVAKIAAALLDSTLARQRVSEDSIRHLKALPAPTPSESTAQVDRR